MTEKELAYIDMEVAVLNFLLSVDKLAEARAIIAMKASIDALKKARGITDEDK